MNLKTDVLELRGVATRVSKKTGSNYYVIFTEAEDGQPYQFVCKDYNILPSGLKKGDLIELHVRYNSFKELNVYAVRKVD